MDARKPRFLSFPAVLLGSLLVAPAPLLAGGEGAIEPPPVSAAPPPAPRSAGPSACTSAAPIGQVVAVTGDAHAGPPGATRPLACDGPIACEEITTGPDASVSFLSGDVLVHVGPDARVELAGSEGAPEVFVHEGSVRTTDARTGEAAPSRLAAHDLSATAAGADLELSAAPDAPSRLCALDGEASVDAGPSARTLRSGECLAATGSGLASSPAAAPSVGVGDGGACGFAVALDDHLTPGDVAAPDALLFPAFGPAADIVRDPCDEPGSGCVGTRSIPFDDPDPVPGCGIPGVEC